MECSGCSHELSFMGMRLVNAVGAIPARLRRAICSCQFKSSRAVTAGTFFSGSALCSMDGNRPTSQTNYSNSSSVS